MAYEGSKTDRVRDRIGMKSAGVKSMANWERTMVDRREDAMNDRANYRHQREPKRIRLYVDAHGPYFKDGAMSRGGHDPFKKDD